MYLFFKCSFRYLTDFFVFLCNIIISCPVTVSSKIKYLIDTLLAVFFPFFNILLLFYFPTTNERNIVTEFKQLQIWQNTFKSPAGLVPTSLIYCLKISSFSSFPAFISGYVTYRAVTLPSDEKNGEPARSNHLVEYLEYISSQSNSKTTILVSVFSQ